jgi:hypothetical protein
LEDAPRELRSAQPTPTVKRQVRETTTRTPSASGHRRRLICASRLHALPKSIRRKDDKPAGAILGFASFLLRRYREEQPRAVLVGWDTYEAPTYRHEAFPTYQSGRAFDDDVIEQLAVMRGAALEVVAVGSGISRARGARPHW